LRHRRACPTQGFTPFWLAALLLVVQLGPASARVAAAEAVIPPEMEARTRAVFERFTGTLAADYPELENYSIQVVQEKVANAWINQKYEISVTTGLLELLPTDDQLGGVIGHEIAHGLLGHIPHRINQSIWSAFAVLALGVLSSTQGQADWGGLLEMRDLFMYAFSREQETDADLMGLRLAQRVGYDPRGLVEALELMDDQRRGLPPDSIWQQLYQTHPPLSQRIFELRLVLATDAWDRTPQGPAVLGLAGPEGSPEEAARRFAQALWAGDEASLRTLVMPTRTEDVSRWLATYAGQIDPGWALGELEIAERRVEVFDEVLIVRLWRPRPGGEGEESTPPVAVTLRKSARGYLVTNWEAAEL